MENISLGSESHQRKILFHIFYSNKFPKDAVAKLESQHFTEEKHKIIFTLIKNYLDKYNDLPDIKNIVEIIRNQEQVSIPQRNAWIKELKLLVSEHEVLLKGESKNDFEFIKSSVIDFIKVRELSLLSSNDIKRIVETGDFSSVNSLTDKLRRIISLGDDEDDPADVEEFTEDLFTQRYRGHIPTGLVEIDKIITGLPKGKMGIFIAGQGVGKSTILINTSVNSFKAGSRVLHVIFGENTKEDVQLLVSTALTGISFKDAQKNPKEAYNKAQEVIKLTKTKKHGVLKIQRFNSSELTMPKLKNWIIKYQKKVGYTFDQINIDYVDEMISHLRSQSDQWAGEKDVVGAFLDMLVEFDICGWTATQAKKESNNKKLLDINDCGGSVAKVKKAQVVITIGRDADDRNQNRATFHLAKSNISPSGHIFENAIFDTSHMKFELPKPTGGKIIEEFDDDVIEDTEYTEVKPVMIQDKNDEFLKNNI
jgi:replicative DNA helicase